MTHSSTPLGKVLDWYESVGVTETIGTEASGKLGQPTQKLQIVETKKSVESTVPVLSRSDIPTTFQPMDLRQACTLTELKAMLLSYGGCALKKTAMNTVFADGAEDADVMLVGEAPGADEDREGLPFVGRSGQLLDNAFATIGLSRQKNLYISNIISWRPPGNRPPTTIEITQCLPFIRRHIELKRPKILVMVGSVSAKALLDSTEGITKMRGQWLEYKSEGLESAIPAIAIYHPAFLLRSPGQKKKLWFDLLKLSKKLKEIA